MKIVVGGSMTFAKEQLKAKNYLEKNGHEVLITDDLEDHLDPNKKANFTLEEEIKHSIKYDIIRAFFEKIAESDAYLIINKEKNGIAGYLGTCVLMEIGLAYYLKKKIFLYNEIDRKQNYAPEVLVINPVVINGDLTKVK